MFSGDVVRAVYPDFKAGGPDGHATRIALPADGAAKAKGPNGPNGPHRAIPIRGLNAATSRWSFAPEGGAVPGDRIVGIPPGEGVTICPIQSPISPPSTTNRTAGSTCGGMWTRTIRNVSRPHRAAIDQRTRHPRAGCPGDRRPRRQHRQRLHETPHPRLPRT